MSERDGSNNNLEGRRISLEAALQQAQHDYLEHYAANHKHGNVPVSCHTCGRLIGTIKQYKYRLRRLGSSLGIDD